MADRFTGKLVELRDQQGGQAQCDDKGDPAEEDGFADELPGQFCAGCADDFSDAHFLCPVGGPCGGQVYEIDTGDQQDDDGDKGKEGDVLAADGFVAIAGGVEINVLQAFEGEGAGHLLFSHF